MWTGPKSVRKGNTNKKSSKYDFLDDLHLRKSQGLDNLKKGIRTGLTIKEKKQITERYPRQEDKS